MNEETKTNLRQADAVIEIEGILSEKTLEIVQVDGKDVIRGELSIQTDEHNFVPLNVYINKMTKNNTENKAYKGMVTVMENYKSVAEVGREDADRVKVVSKQGISPSTYFDESGNQHDSVRYQTNFINRLKDGEEANPKAGFEVEIYIQSITPEIATTEDGSEETGRLKVLGYMPTYNSIEPLTLIVPVSYVDDEGNENEVASVFESMFEPGQTARFFGELVNERITVTETIPVAFGKPRTKTKTSYTNELVINGASDPYDEEKAYDAETIQKALVDREAILEEKKNKAMSGNRGNGNKPSGAASGRKLPTGGAKPKFTM